VTLLWFQEKKKKQEIKAKEEEKSENREASNQINAIENIEEDKSFRHIEVGLV
jgi:hypothetical protein